MAADGTLKLAIDSRGVQRGGQITSRSLKEIEKASMAAVSQLKQQNKANVGLEKTSKKASTSIDKQTTSTTRLSKSMGALKSAIAGISLGLFAKELIDTAIATDRITTSLKFATGDAKKASEEFQFIRRVSKELGLNVQIAATEFAKFAAAAKGSSLEGEGVRKIFLGVSKASAAMSLSADDTSGVFRALTQMMSKGKVQAEELRGQLGERLPGAFKLAAESLGLTTAELDKFLSTGKVTAEDLLPNMAEQWEKSFGKTAQEAAGNTQAKINRLKNTIFELNQALVRAGITEVFEDLATYAAKFAKDTTEGVKVLQNYFGKRGQDSPRPTMSERGRSLADIDREIARITKTGNSTDFMPAFEYGLQQRRRLKELELERALMVAQMEKQLQSGNLLVTGGDPMSGPTLPGFTPIAPKPKPSRKFTPKGATKTTASDGLGPDFMSMLGDYAGAYDDFEARTEEVTVEFGKDWMEAYSMAANAYDDLMRDMDSRLTDSQKMYRSWAHDFTDAMTDAFMGTRTSFSDMINSMLRDAMRLQVQKNITRPLMNMFPSIFGTDKVAAQNNALGGMVGSFHGGQSVVPASAFVNAPHFASGGMVGGPAGSPVPVIAHAGEMILNKGQQKALGATQVNIFDQRGSGSPVEVSETQGEDGTKIIDVTIKDSVRAGILNGDFDKEMRGVYGIKRAGR